MERAWSGRAALGRFSLRAPWTGERVSLQWARSACPSAGRRHSRSPACSSERRPSQAFRQLGCQSGWVHKGGRSPTARGGPFENADALAGSRIQADQTLSKEAVAGTMNTVVIVRRRAERQADVAQCVIRAHHRPDVRCPRRLPRTVLPSLVTKLSLSGNDMEYPLLLAGADVEATYVTGWHRCSQGNIVDVRTHNHNVATNDR